MARLILLVGILTISIPAWADLIKTVGGGERRNVIVKKETYTKIYYYFQIDPQKKQQSIPISQVVEVIRDDEKNLDYKSAQDFFKEKQYVQAIGAYKNAAAYQDWTEQHALFKLAQCYYLQKNVNKAIASFNALLKKFPDSLYAPQAHDSLGECYVYQKKLDDASREWKRASDIYQEIKKDGEWMEVMYKLGGLKQKQNRAGDATLIYQKMIEKGDKYPEWKQRATLRLSLSLLQKKGQEEKAKANLLNILRRSGKEERDLLGGIYVGLGHYYFNKQDTKNALLCYLRVVLLYPEDDDYSITAYEKAAYCFDLLKDKNPEYRARAQQLKEMRRQKYLQAD